MNIQEPPPFHYLRVLVSIKCVYKMCQAYSFAQESCEGTGNMAQAHIYHYTLARAGAARPLCFVVGTTSRPGRLTCRTQAGLCPPAKPRCCTRVCLEILLLTLSESEFLLV